MPTLRNPKKKLKSTTAKKTAATASKKSVATASKKSAAAKKTVAPAQKKAPPARKKTAARARTAAPVKKKPAVTAKKKTGTNKTVAPAKPVEDTSVVHGSQAAFQRFLPQARALAADEVTGLRFDPELAYYNVRIGVAALEPHRDTLKLELPRLDLGQLFALSELGQALLFAASQAAADSGAASSGPSLKELLGEALKVRGQLLIAADTLVAFGLVPEKTVAKIHEGRGSLDTARDLGDLAALYSKYGAAFRQSTPVTAAQAKRAAELGSTLLARLAPGAARRVARAVPQSEAVSDRDRLATLVVRGHRELRRAGYWVWGEEFDAHVPPLLSRARPRKKAVGAEPQAAQAT